MKQLFLCCIIYLPFYLASQKTVTPKNFSDLDTRYFEDQFYAGITYNFLLNRPTNVNQRNFSYGLQAGFIKDIPVNFERTFAFGIGFGLGLNTYYSNLEAIKIANGIDYSIATSNFKRSKLATHLIEMPLELRFRNSTPYEYKFWRLYTGFKLGYVFNARSKFVRLDSKNSFNNPDIQNFQYGIIFNLGYNTFNFHGYYALSSLFRDHTTVNGEDITITPLQIGLIFYIL